MITILSAFSEPSILFWKAAFDKKGVQAKIFHINIWSEHQKTF